MSVEGDTAFIGASHDNNDKGDKAGSVYVFVRSGGEWTQESKLRAGMREHSNFGYSVSLDGDTALIGARDGYRSDAGAAYLFVRSGTSWTEEVKLVEDNGTEVNRFGEFLSLSGRTAFIGSSYPDSIYLTFSAAYVFSMPNQAPLAHAGPARAAVQGEDICFDGSGSSDPDGDTLEYTWTLTAWPAGSGAELDNPTAVQPCLVADLPGTYEVSLIVNDGTVDSAPDSAEAVTVSYLNAVSETLLEAGSVLNRLDPAVFKGKRKAEQRRKQLARMINRALALTDRGRYLPALKLLRRDVLKRIDGCAISGQAHRNDWIQDCAAQEEVYLLITEAVGYLEEAVALPALIELLEQAGVTVGGLDADIFKRKRHQAELVRHIDRTVELVGRLEYRKALRHLRGKVLHRLDGCAKAGRAHKKDWIQDCAAQEQVYPLLMEAVNGLKNNR